MEVQSSRYAAASTPQTPAVTQSPLLVTVANAKLGNILTATNGMTVYTYSKDTKGVSNCTGACEANWPPYTMQAGANISAIVGLTGTVGNITRADGTMQITFNGMPLYFYVKDTKAGDTMGQGVGGVWYVVKAQ